MEVEVEMTKVRLVSRWAAEQYESPPVSSPMMAILLVMRIMTLGSRPSCMGFPVSEGCDWPTFSGWLPISC